MVSRSCDIRIKKKKLKITVSEETKSEGCFLALSYLAGQEGWSKKESLQEDLVSVPSEKLAMFIRFF